MTTEMQYAESPSSRTAYRCALKRIAVAAASLAALLAADAKTCVWTGAEASDVYLYTGNSANWQDGQVPVEGDTVVISPTSSKVIIWTFSFSMENFYYTNTCGGVITANRGCKISVTGTESQIVNVQSGHLYLYTPHEVAAGARLTIRPANGAVTSEQNDIFRGSGEILVMSENGKEMIFRSHPNFHGTWTFRSPVQVVGTTGGVTQFPFGADDCTVNVHGKASTNSTDCGKLTFYGAAEVAGTVNLFGNTEIGANPVSSNEDGLITFRGNVSYAAGAGFNQMALSCNIGNADRRSGFVFLGDCVCVDGNGARMNIYTYSPAGTFHFEVRGRFCPSTAWNAPPAISLLPAGSQAKADVRLGGPVSCEHAWKLAPRSRQHFHLLSADILPKGAIMVGWDAGTTTDSFLDLHGHDQTISGIAFHGNGPHDFTVKSSERPATLHVGNHENVVHTMPLLSGMLSVYAYDNGSGNNAGLKFANEGDLTGWIGTEKNALTFTAEAKYPNLGGIECTGAGSVSIESGATFNPEMTLDVHDVTGDGIRLSTGADLTVKHAFVEDVDLPAGVYCRTGAGGAGATEVDWLKAGRNEATDAQGGTVIVTAHDPVWIWTGNGTTGSFTNPANWGANAAPDLTNATLTLNFKNAAGKPDVIVPLDGTVAPAGAVNCGDYGKGAVTFGGTGTLVLGGVDDDLKMVFTDASSLTWNGTGTLRLTGKSTSSGTLTINSGKVVLESASWTGAIVVAAGAELVVDATCGSEVFGPIAENESTCRIALSGKLTLGDGIAASVQALSIDGNTVRYGKTCGSPDSTAVRTDSAHFGGTGTVVSYRRTGMRLIVR